MSQTYSDTPPPTSALGDRGFWGIFAAGWLAYLGLYVSAGVSAEGLQPRMAVVSALANTLPVAGLSLVVAWRRSDLLRPEWPLGRTVLLHLGVALVFAVAAAAVTLTVARQVGWEGPASESTATGTEFLFRVISALFLYVILAGFLMWSESIRRVNESRTLAAREAMLRAQAEAKALRAQFNPHFVFNTLHSLILLVRADPTAAERAIEDVAELIRYASTLQRRDVDLVPLSKELEVARRYLALEKLRLDDRLRTEWTVEVEPANVMIPAFAIQTLIENSVRHGLETRAEGGTIRVEIGRTGTSMNLTVADDGDGADAEQVAAASGRGLQLLTRRLAALYGDDASLSWETSKGGGFTVRVRLPVQPPPVTGPDTEPRR